MESCLEAFHLWKQYTGISGVDRVRITWLSCMDKPGFYFCICPDSLLAREHVHDMLASCGYNDCPVTVFWADEGLGEKFWDVLTLQGLGSSRQTLFIRNAQILSAEVWKKLSGALGIPRPGIMPVFFFEGAWEKGQPKLPAYLTRLKCFEFAGKKRWIWRSPSLDSRGIRNFLQERAKFRNLTLEPNTLEILEEILPPDAAAISAVVEQLALLVDDGVVRPEHTKEIASYVPDMVLFDLIRHIQDGRLDKALELVLREGDNSDGVLFPLLTLMTREARILWQLLAGENVYVPQHIVGLKRRLAANLGFRGIAKIFAALSKAEWNVKSGQLQPGQALEELIAELVRLFTFPRKHTRTD